MEVVAANNCCVEMSALEIDNFTYNGGQQNKIVTRDMGNFDNMNVQLGMYGSVYLQDVTLRNFSIKADSMIGLRLDEIAMLKLVQFKRN
ncbi:hypothetical protein [Chitinophaga sancti]|uniref:hypothetical protein n=1 Tax=Chitinophaga sancti TaxID=1004 RepID=UPI003F79D4BA